MQRGSVLPIILILIVVAGLVVGVYFLQNSRTNTTSEASYPVQQVFIKPSPSPQEEIVNIENVDLSLKLPAGFDFMEESEEEHFVRANGNIRKNFNYYIQYDPAGFSESFYIVPASETNLNNSVLSAVIYDNPDNLDPMSFYDKYWYYPFVWGDFTSRRNEIAPENSETIGGKTGGSGVVTYRPGKPKFIYLPIPEKNLMMQIQLPTENNEMGGTILKSFIFE